MSFFLCNFAAKIRTKSLISMKNLLKSSLLFAAGAAVGAAVVLLATTEEGAQVREKIKNLVKEAGDAIQEAREEVTNPKHEA